MTVWGKIIIGDSRNMAELTDGTIGLVVTSPPYWHLKDYGVPERNGQRDRPDSRRTLEANIR